MNKLTSIQGANKKKKLFTFYLRSENETGHIEIVFSSLKEAREYLKEKHKDWRCSLVNVYELSTEEEKYIWEMFDEQANP